MNNRIEINTIFGTLFAEVNEDSQYPGITVCIEQEGTDGKYDKQLAVAECTPNVSTEGGHTLRLLVWDGDDAEDFTDDFTFLEDRPEESPEAVWEKYLEYLRDWSESHKEPGFYGMTPACFDEWFGAEYSREQKDIPVRRMTQSNNYKITIDGNEDFTVFTMILRPKEKEFVDKLCSLAHGTSMSKFEPTMRVEEIS